ncbi:RNA polymerase sigma-70 factor [Niastella sp. OAS944]|uniref:RNA polymerase sigma-70 factor n=1 Tax=Niastella sp. OAS944 TaxID=2664089 RepID=UPI00347CE0BF|nr:RNA polymerase sigma-70 factor (ECF subfamily) [Chitinophagaceae bacterium OAS944]
MAAARSNNDPIDLSVLDRKEYELLFHQYYQWLCLQACKITEDWHASEDIVQDFFIKCWQNRASLHIKQSFAAFALVSVRNAALNYLKKESIRSKHETASSATFPGDETLLPVAQPDETDQLYLQIITAVNNLPEQRKKAFILSRQHNMKYAEVAAELGISVNTVKMHLRLAYQELRNLLKLLLPLFYFFLKK